MKRKQKGERDRIKKKEEKGNERGRQKRIESSGGKMGGKEKEKGMCGGWRVGVVGVGEGKRQIGSPGNGSGV